ncbi:DUF2218 domain-containing protein [Loktanella salsilacus]|uniref:DUF2218 domain-containing protein n=1 Tax=Loktanella salsilacus TaxID=195913 RepID=UPI0037354638
MQPEITDRGEFRTEHASRYLQQLCKHFAHKVDVQFDETAGSVAFPFGPATLTATDDALIAVVTAPTEDKLRDARRAIDSQLVTFAFREGFTTMTWGATAPA